MIVGAEGAESARFQATVMRSLAPLFVSMIFVQLVAAGSALIEKEAYALAEAAA